MILRGSIRGGGAALASYLLTKGENSRVEVFDIRGTSQPDDLKKSLSEMSLSVELSGRTKKGLYHVVINPRPDEAKKMSVSDWHRAAEIIEEVRGFTGQKRVMVLHEKKGRLHLHCVWERYNHDTGLIISNQHSHRQEKRARTIMETEFQHLRTPDQNAERPALKKLLGGLWTECPSGKEFLSAIKKSGYTVAKQEGRRPYVIINSVGHSFELIKEIPGIRIRQLREKLKGIDLPDKLHVIEAIRQKQKTMNKEKTREEIANELKQILARDKQKSRGR